MHRDKKIGFALGILLVGIVAAFFFRNEPDPFAELPPLDDPQSLDAEIAEKSFSPYADEADAKSSELASASPPRNPWQVPEPYRPNTPAALESAGLPITAGAPAPINLLEPIPDPTPVDRRPITVGSPFGRLEKVQPEPPLPGNENWTAVPEKKPALPEQAPPANLAKTAPSVPETPASPTSLYKIVPGDTLSVLAEKHLGSSRRYLEIYEANRDLLRNPNDIKVGMLIRIPPRVKFDGETSSPELVQPENTTPFRQETTSLLPPPVQTSRFMPFSRSPLGPVAH